MSDLTAVAAYEAPWSVGQTFALLPRPTGIQHTVLAAVEALWASGKRGVTVREVMAQAGLNDVRHTHSAVLALCASGLLERQPGKPRTLVPRARA